MTLYVLGTLYWASHIIIIVFSHVCTIISASLFFFPILFLISILHLQNLVFGSNCYLCIMVLLYLNDLYVLYFIVYVHLCAHLLLCNAHAPYASNNNNILFKMPRYILWLHGFHGTILQSTCSWPASLQWGRTLGLIPSLELWFFSTPAHQKAARNETSRTL